MGTQKNSLYDDRAPKTNVKFNGKKKIFSILCLKFLFDSTLVTISSVKASEVELMIIGHLQLPNMK